MQIYSNKLEQVMKLDGDKKAHRILSFQYGDQQVI